MKFCTFLTATMGLSSSFVPKVAEVFAAPKQRPPVIWLHFAECTGCSESLLRSMYPWIDELVLEILSVEYHETIMAAAGHQAEENLHEAVKNTPASSSACVKAPLPPSTTAVTARSPGKSFLESPRTWFPKPRPPLHRQLLQLWRRSWRPLPTPADMSGCRKCHSASRRSTSRLSAQPGQFVGTIVNYLLLGKLPAWMTWAARCLPTAKPSMIQCPRSVPL
jgi:[NiFe] hydrogenase small subunit